MSQATVHLDVIEIKDSKGRSLLHAQLPEARITTTDPYPNTALPSVGPTPETLSENNLWANWGERDTLPTDIRKGVEQVPMAGTAISKLVSMMYGNGLLYYKESDLNDGVVRPAYIPEVESFIKNNRINTVWWASQCTEYRFMMNAMGSFILSNDKKKIVRIISRTNEHHRLGARDPKTGIIKTIYSSPYFSEGEIPAADKRIEIPYFNMDPWRANTFFEKLKGYEAAYHVKFPSPGSQYYGRPWWIGLFAEDGWIDVAKSVPKVINAMQENQITLKYQINIPESYFEVRTQNWLGLTADARKNIIDKKIDEINENLKGSENAFSSIASVFKENPVTHQAYGKIEIIAVDDKTKKDAWVPNSNTADAQIVQGLGLHPSQVGLSPEGGKMGAGSGSDQRESFNSGLTLNTIDQEILLEPLNFISDFNGWGIKWYVDHTFHTTTNNSETGLVEEDSALKIEGQ